jgi:hypothetical protein
VLAVTFMVPLSLFAAGSVAYIVPLSLFAAESRGWRLLFTTCGGRAAFPAESRA